MQPVFGASLKNLEPNRSYFCTQSFMLTLRAQSLCEYQLEILICCLKLKVHLVIEGATPSLSIYMYKNSTIIFSALQVYSLLLTTVLLDYTKLQLGCIDCY